MESEENGNKSIDVYKTAFDLVRNGSLAEFDSFVKEVGETILNARDEWGYTLAHWAALDGNIELIRYLSDNGVSLDLSCTGTQGPKPIHWACRKGNVGVIDAIINAGVSVNTVDFKGLTPLMTACMYGRVTTTVYLLGMGARHDLVDINGDSAVHWAAFKGHPEIIRLLINAGADLQKPDNFGSTPLHLASLNGNVNCVKILCDTGNINLELKDKNGKTPLMLAKNHRKNEVVKLLSTEIKQRYKWVSPISELWSFMFGGFQSNNSKGPLYLFVGSFVFWCYPMYFLRCIPLTWDILRGSHYCFIYWNVQMWIAWTIANRRDPGYLPTNSEKYSRIISQIPFHEKTRKQNIILSRLCHTCCCVRPLRAKHCRVCNRCVAYFDHHCPFIHNCVGLKNRLWFFLFVLCTAVNCSFTVYFTIYCISQTGIEMLYVLSLAESLIFFCFGWVLTAVSLLHACMNLTTNEMLNYKRYPYLRDRRGKYYNLFSRGLFFNLIEFFTYPYSCGKNNHLIDEVV